MRVTAIDPGGTTGMASVVVGLNATIEDFACWAIEGQMSAVEAVQNWLAATDVLVIERFTINAATLRKTREGSNMAIEIIGAARWLAHERGIPFVLQAPADAMTFMTDAKLKRLGWYKPGKDHARDAARHVGLYCFRNGLLPASLLTSSEEEEGT